MSSHPPPPPRVENEREKTTGDILQVFIEFSGLHQINGREMHHLERVTNLSKKPAFLLNRTPAGPAELKLPLTAGELVDQRGYSLYHATPVLSTLEMVHTRYHASEIDRTYSALLEHHLHQSFALFVYVAM